MVMSFDVVFDVDSKQTLSLTHRNRVITDTNVGNSVFSVSSLSWQDALVSQLIYSYESIENRSLLRLSYD